MVDIFFKYKDIKHFGYKMFKDYWALVTFLDNNYSRIKVYYIYDYEKHSFIFNFSDF